MATTTSITEQIAALRTALADSKLEVTIGDATVRYKSNTELIAALEKLESIANVASTGHGRQVKGSSREAPSYENNGKRNRLNGITSLTSSKGDGIGLLACSTLAKGNCVTSNCGQKSFREAYAGAKLTPPSLKEYWGTRFRARTTTSGKDRQKVANRVRQLVRDMPWMDGAITAATDYKIGEGFNFKPAVTDEQGKMIREVNMKIKDAFLFWCEKAGANNRDTFGDLQRLAVRQMIECGEVLYIHRNQKPKILDPDP